jgi:hypothetical protein
MKSFKEYIDRQIEYAELMWDYNCIRDNKFMNFISRNYRKKNIRRRNYVKALYLDWRKNAEF